MGRNDMTTIEEAIAEGVDQSIAAKKKKVNKFGVTPKTMEMVLEAHCADVGIAYSESWIGQTYGNATHFIKDCEKKDLVVNDVLFDICKYWKRFNAGQLKKGDDKTIVLGDSVHFRKFFAHRDQILGYIKIHKTAWEEAEENSTEIIYEKL
jgi:hypothetical protein